MYSISGRVRYSEVDASLRLTVTGMMNYLQDCSTFQSEDLDLGVASLNRRCRAWWLSTWQIVVERWPVLGEEIVVSTWPYAFKGIYGYRNFTIRDRLGDYLVKADSVWFFFDTAEGRPVRPGEDDIRGYELSGEKRLDMASMARHIPVPSEYETAEPITVARHHIDTNHHVNNAQYVEIARELLPENFQIRELRAEYKKAAVLGDRMFPHIHKEDGAYTIALTDADGEIFAVVWMRQT
ncbi:MAG: acyl-[acyl-carrier-protein] thioesterase [Clostridiales bacterium]|nr:acyl-[acyl-carrier-protein] thioesterase [Clostridiales bacterium]